MLISSGAAQKNLSKTPKRSAAGAWREIMGRTPQAELFANGYRPMDYHPDGGGSGGGGGGGNGVAQTVKALHSGGGQRWWRRHAGQPQ
jgi:hypothetical protein